MCLEDLLRKDLFVNINKFSLNFIILLSEQNGGYPINISYIITPKLHQSQAESYPVFENTSGAI
jgi:hypothetical protein